MPSTQESNKNPTFGILLTGYLHKQTARHRTRPWERRFTVLTKVGMHWFRRVDGYDMFGEETGHVMLTDVTSVGPSQEIMGRREAENLKGSCNDLQELEKEEGSPSGKEKVTVYSFIVKSKDGYTRIFRCSSESERERWIEAITMTIAAIQYSSQKALDAASNDSPPPLRERGETMSGVDFAPIGSPFKKPKYLYHSSLGGNCWGGSKAPIPKVVTCGSKVIFETGSTEKAPWGEASVLKVSVGGGDAVKIFLSNGGCATIDDKSLEEMAKDNEGYRKKSLTGVELESTKVEVVGMRYPGEPLLVARLDVAVVPEGKAATKNCFSIVKTGFYAVQPVLLAAFSGANILPAQVMPHLSHQNAFAVWAFFAFFDSVSLFFSNFIAKGDAPMTYRVVLKSYEESEAHIFDDSLEAPVPKRFIEGTKNDPPGTAEKRWATTMAWRKREKIDTLILQPHLYYREIKKCYPHFYCGTDLSNKQICYYERPGYLELKRLEEIGVPTMVWHYNFQTEFCWTYMSTNGEETRTLSGIDVDNVGLYDVKGVVKEFLQAISKISQEHYPERAGKICVLNAPSWFSMLWNVIKLTLHPNTQKKVFILSQSAAKKTMKTLIEHTRVPTEYGGDLKFTDEAPTVNKDFYGPLGKEKERARYCSEYEVALDDYIRRLNEKQKLPLPPDVAFEREDVIISKEDYLKAYEHGWEKYKSQLHLPKSQWDPEGWPGMLFTKK
ncbi:hypothetical protein TrST_g4992 [Triparma strigata]|uniref:CRAL-TRIO domain-containing protein n=1 Tax=Triparma strigata TaxID=1606541 RepID=A0A9W7AS92_9STRA|nr:hypothetical protein TrST_g4992 [Triparma strigata]